MIPQDWKKEMPAFVEKTNQFYAGEVKVNEYKGFSGFYGSYAQKGAKASMLRLRMNAGRFTKEKLNYVCSAIQEHKVTHAHFTTCQTIQLHDLQPEQIFPIMENALDVGIVCMGGGGDFPRNVMCSPLSGVEKDEYFDVMPYAEKTAEFLLGFIKAEKMPRKLKVCFSNSKKNMPHATFRDLGFVAKENGLFDVYSAGGLGNNPRFGVLVAEDVQPEDILYYVKAMRATFIQHGNYDNRAKARSRYIVEKLGGEEEYKKAFLENLDKVKSEDLKISVEIPTISKEKDGEISAKNIIAQKQDGLYAVCYHPIGGSPDVDVLIQLNEAIQKMDQVEIRLAPDESAYIINCSAKEAEIIQSIIEKDNAQTTFETSVSCVGASVCQVGLRDSQALLKASVKAVRQANIKDGALPQIHISGCPSSCGTHQTGPIGFRGHTKLVDKKPMVAFMLYIGGNDYQGKEKMGKEMGPILDTQIPDFLVQLGKTVEASHLTFDEWYKQNPDIIEEIAKSYI